MEGGHRIDQNLAYRILKEGLLYEHQITIEDSDIFRILKSASEGNKGAMKYLQNATEIQQLLEVLQGLKDTYTIKNFDKILSHLKEHTDNKDMYHVRCNEFYVETFSDMLYYLKNSLLDLQNMDSIIHFTQSISKNRSKLEKIQFPEGHDDLTFIVKVSLDKEDGALVHQVWMGKTSDMEVEQQDSSAIDEESQDPNQIDDNDNTQEDNDAEYDDNDAEYDDNDGLDDIYDGDDYNSQDPILFNTEQFIPIRSKRTYDKNMILIILKNVSYEENLFTVFRLDEKQIGTIKK